MVEVTLVSAMLIALVLLRALAIVRLRKRIAVPPSHPAERRRAALNRAALDADWNWPR